MTNKAGDQNRNERRAAERRAMGIPEPNDKNTSAATWSITLSCGHTYRLLTAVPDLKTPYICARCGNLRFVDMAVRNKEATS